jgi:hypothetical protein
MIRRVGILTLMLLSAALPVGAQPTPGGPPAEQTVVPAAPAGTPFVGQVTVTTTATLLRAANTSRSAVVLVNHGSTNVFIGFTSAVTSTTGVMLVGIPGQTLTIQTRSSIYGIVASGTQVVGFYEEIR